MRSLSFLFLLLSIFTISFHLSAQTEAWSGRWQGALELPGIKLDMSIELNQEAGQWQGNLDIPQQRVQDMTLADLRIEGDSLSFRMPEVPGNASYAGRRTEDRIEGLFRQGGQSIALVFRRDDPGDAAKLQAKLTQIRRLVDSLLKGADVPGVGLGIIYKGETILADGFGYRNVEKKAPVTANTIFAIGSASKAFTTMGLALLEDQGKLDWDKPVRNYLPDFHLKDELATREMTAVDLTTHRSGLPRHDLLWYMTDLDRKELLHRLRYLEPTASFRAKWQYQNLMYMTTGVLIEELSGQSWEDFTRDHIFQPLGMTNANFSVTKLATAPDHAIGYGSRDDKLIVLPYRRIDAIGPAGSINASVTDMLKWVELQLGNGKVDGKTFVSAANLDRMHSPQMAMSGPIGISLPGISHRSYGLGWFIYDKDGRYVVEHGGNIDGFSALVFTMPEEELGMVILTNKNGTALPGILAFNISEMLLDEEPKDYFTMIYGQQDEEKKEDDAEEEDNERRVTGTQPHHPLADYTGEYTDPGYGSLFITEKSGRLYAKYYKMLLPLEHWHYETFQGKLDTLGITIPFNFRTDRKGYVTGVEVPMEGALADLYFSKKPADRLRDTTFLALLAGKYELRGMTVTISRKGNELTMTVPGQPVYTLEPYQGTEFKLKELSGFTAEFVLEKDRPVALISHQPNGDFRMERIE